MTDKMDKLLKEYIDEEALRAERRFDAEVKRELGIKTPPGNTKIAKVVEAIKPPKSTPRILAMHDALMDQHDDLQHRLDERKYTAKKLLAEVEAIQNDIERIEYAMRALKT